MDTNKEIEGNEIPDRLPPDYQHHLDHESDTDKMKRLDDGMKLLMDMINNKLKAVF